MKCDKCGGNVAQGQRFCDLCGNEVAILTPNQQPQYGQNTYGNQQQQYGQNPYGGQPQQAQNPYGGQPQQAQNPYGGQPQYGQNPYAGQPQYGQTPYAGQPQYGQNPYGGQPQYGQNPYGGQPQYGQNPYGGQPQYGQNPYGGQPQYGQRPVYNSGVAVENFNLVSAYIAMWKKCFQFNGRSRRSEYWWASLGQFLVSLAVYAVFYFLINIAHLGIAVATFERVLTVCLSLPTWALSVRRLHDVGKSGWLVLLSFIPCVGSIILLIYTLTDSQPGINKYGANPKGF